MLETPFSIFLRPGNPDFLDLPWEKPLSEWRKCCDRVEELPRGVSRHPVVFINYDGELFAFKELALDRAEYEYNVLRSLEDKRLPVVKAVGYVRISSPTRQASILITDYLDHSQPYRSLFIRSEMKRYQEHLLDAVAGLLVQLHLNGVFWGDCSLSNTLFRRDAGALQAYLVDAETTQLQEELIPKQRYDDLMIMKDNITSELADLAASRLLPRNYPLFEIGESIRKRYLRLWEKITSEVILRPTEHYRIQEHVRALNDLGFSVHELELSSVDKGSKLRLKAFVSDRNFHRDQLHALTGLEAEEKQAQQIINEIQEIKASLSQKFGREISLPVAAYHWLEHNYQPFLEYFQPYLEAGILSPTEMYCQILEHKWFLSERTEQDVGFQAAMEDYMEKYLPVLFSKEETQENQR